MISRRAKRSPAPQESLKQFALNSSKGIDSNKPPTDLSTVLGMKNLTVNLDGSVSLRKRMLYLRTVVEDGHTLLNAHIAYTDEHTIAVVRDSKGTVALRAMSRAALGVGECLPIYYKIRDYYTYDEITLDGVEPSDFKLDDATFVNTTSSTIVANCYVSAQMLTDCGAIDADLYDESAVWLPRYIQLVFEKDTSRWCATIVSPELNRLTNAEGEPTLNPNLTLDNPYAIRDSYGNVIPSVKGIIPYVLTTSDGSLADATLSYEYTAEAQRTVFPTIPTHPDFSKNVITKEEDGNGTFFSESYEFDSAPYTFRLYNVEDATYLYANLPADFKGSVELEATAGEYDTEGTLIGTVVKIVDRTITKSGEYEVGHLTPTSYNTNIVVGAYSIYITRTVAKYEEAIKNLKISEVTENCTGYGLKPFSAFKSGSSLDGVFLKAFGNLPERWNTYYATWDYSLDGIDWNPYGPHPFLEFKDRILVKVLKDTWKPKSDGDAPTSSDYTAKWFVPLNVTSAEDVIDGHSNTSRPDILSLGILQSKLSSEETASASYLFRFSIVTLSELESPDSNDATHEISATVSQSEFTLIPDTEYSFLESEYPNAVLGDKSYLNKAIYSYNVPDLTDSAYVSVVGSFNTPLYNILDSSTFSNEKIVSVGTWRGYIVSYTEKAIYLSNRVSEGFTTKPVTTSVGVPLSDRSCAKSTLNGLLFKSGTAVYFAYPNTYSSDDSMLNLVDISNPVKDIIEKLQNTSGQFAEVIDNSYVLFIPEGSVTHCLKYGLVDKLWEYYTFPVKFTKVFKDLNGTCVALGPKSEYLLFEDDYSKVECDWNLLIPAVYCDVMCLGDSVSTLPINFELDTGQKTDGISLQKQFVESKFMFATEDAAEAFPMQLVVAIDGDPHITTLDVNTDAPFWKTGTSSVGVAGTAFRLSSSDELGRADSGILRQLVVRYSGKGRSIRHILTGAPTSNFRLYEAYVRYKTLNVKK